MRTRVPLATVWLAIALVWASTRVEAQDALYFTAVQDARKPILDLIAAETVRIDVAAWWFTDAVISSAIVRRMDAGVKVRFLADTSAYRDTTKTQIDYLASRGVPIRLRTGGTGIVHWKCGIFAGQRKVAFGSANWTVYSLRPYSSTNYDDETVLVTADPELVPAFKMKFDQMWVDTAAFTDFANIAPGARVRLEPDAVLPPSMTWGQGTETNSRLIREIDDEQQYVHFVLYRLESVSVTDALVRRVQGGVPVRLVIDPVQYRNARYPQASANLDRLWALSVPIIKRVHDGMTHMKTIVTSTIATNGSANVMDGWQRDHNYFIDKALRPTLHEQLRARVAAMLADTVGFAGFRPSTPGSAALAAPVNGATGVSVMPLLDWSDAPWATNYDVQMGTSPNTMSTVASRVTTSRVTLGSALLQPSTTYYWRVRARTNATPRDGTLSTYTSTWSFTTARSGNAAPSVSLTAPTNGATFAAPATVTVSASASDSDGAVARVEFLANGSVVCTVTGSPYTCNWTGVAAGSYTLNAVATDNAGARTTSSARGITVSGGASSIVMYAARAPVRAGAWAVVPDASAAGGSRMYNSSNTPTVASPAALPASYFEVRFMAVAGTPYRLWMRGKADGDSYENDSVYVQFSASLDQAGNSAWRIGSAGAIKLVIEECSGCGLSGWGWHDNGWGVGIRGETIRFATSGVQTIRVQQRQDGISIDQIVLSPGTYYWNAPGRTKDDTTILLEKNVASSAGEIVLRAADVPATEVHGDWSVVADSSAASGIRLSNPDRGAGKIVMAAASPTSYFDVTFAAEKGKPYHLWLRMRAENDTYSNDSVFVQFSGSVTSSGGPVNRIGTTEAAFVSLEDTSGAGVQGWGWNDNGWASLGPPVYFAQSGPQRLRVQVREDGVSIDQIVLSAAKYLSTSPGALKNDTTIVPR